MFIQLVFLKTTSDINSMIQANFFKHFSHSSSLRLNSSKNLIRYPISTTSMIPSLKTFRHDIGVFFNNFANGVLLYVFWIQIFNLKQLMKSMNTSFMSHNVSNRELLFAILPKLRPVSRYPFIVIKRS